jgi:hypothetical protein
MICLPTTVFHYEFILLLALIPLLIKLSDGGKDRKLILSVMAFGIVITQIHAAALYFLTENILAYYIPGFGLLLILIANLAIKFERQRVASKQMNVALDAPPL